MDRSILVWEQLMQMTEQEIAGVRNFVRPGLDEI
jgi:hypothetical protein